MSGCRELNSGCQTPSLAYYHYTTPRFILVLSSMEGRSKRKHTNGKRHSRATKIRALELRKSGFTHREIAKKLLISVNSAYLWTAQVELTPEQRREIEKRRIEHLRKVRVFTAQERREIGVRLARYREKYTRQQLVDKIRSFYRSHDRIPLKREFNMWGEYRRHFYSWNDAIRAAGFRPNEAVFSRKFRAADGHMCDSFAECVIDDWLNKNGVVHERNFPYPGSKMTVDFRVGHVFIEYFGLMDVSERYRVLVRRKREICSKTGFVLHEIFPDDLFSKNYRRCLGNILRRLRESGVV